MTSTGPERAKVMDACEENGTDGYPENCGDPTPVNGDRRPDDRCSAGNGSEMMAPQDIFVGGMKIDAVIELMRRSDEIRIQLIDFCCDKFGIDEPAERHAGDPKNNNHDGLHR